MRICRSLISLAGLAAGALLLSLPAEANPNFSGTWKLEEKGSGGGPRNIVFEIEHKEPRFRYTATGVTGDGERFTEAVEFTTDGEEHAGIYDGKVAAHWEGESIVIRFTITGNEYKVVMRLSPDGKQMFRDAFGHREVYNRE